MAKLFRSVAGIGFNQAIHFAVIVTIKCYKNADVNEIIVVKREFIAFIPRNADEFDDSSRNVIVIAEIEGNDVKQEM